MCTGSPAARSKYDRGASGPFMSRTSGLTQCVLWKRVRSIQADRFTICKRERLGGENDGRNIQKESEASRYDEGCDSVCGTHQRLRCGGIMRAHDRGPPV